MLGGELTEADKVHRAGQARKWARYAGKHALPERGPGYRVFAAPVVKEIDQERLAGFYREAIEPFVGRR